MENVKPVEQLRTDRGLLKYWLLGAVTMGIYPLVVETHISRELNLVVTPHDGKKTLNYLLIVFLLSWLTLGIMSLVWFHGTSARMGAELNRRGLGYSFGAKDFWLWCILGACLFGIGPLVYIHKRMKAMNLINADYNVKG